MTEQERLWIAYQAACDDYERAPTVDHWFLKVEAHRIWAREFLGGKHDQEAVDEVVSRRLETGTKPPYVQ